MKWATVRVDSVAPEVRESIDPSIFGDDEVHHWSIPALDATGVPSVEPASSIGSAKIRLTGGEILVSRLNPRKARVIRIPAALDGLHVCSGEFVVLRPTAVEQRFLEYALRSEKTRQQFDANVQSVTRSHQRMRPEQVRQFQLSLPTRPRQRAIADFLDTETAHVDALITRKRQLRVLLQQRRWAKFDALVGAIDAQVVPLRRALISVTDGPFGSAFSSSEYSEDGVVVVRLGNIGFAQWLGDGLAFLPVRRAKEFEQFRVQHGDLLVAGLGDLTNHAGRACVAPDLGPAIVKGKCFCARIDQAVAIPMYLALYCSSPTGANAMAGEARGSTRSMINLDIFKSVPIPLPGLSIQRRIVEAVQVEWDKTGAIRDRLDRQIALLQERRQALITAAVTGVLDLAEAG